MTFKLTKFIIKFYFLFSFATSFNARGFIALNSYISWQTTHNNFIYFSKFLFLLPTTCLIISFFL